jgi:hypothetical protein
VHSTREGHLVLRLRTDEGEIELRGTAGLRVFDDESPVPLVDLWSRVGSEALIACGRDGETLIMDSIAIR